MLKEVKIRALSFYQRVRKEKPYTEVFRRLNPVGIQTETLMDIPYHAMDLTSARKFGRNPQKPAVPVSSYSCLITNNYLSLWITWLAKLATASNPSEITYSLSVAAQRNSKVFSSPTNAESEKLFSSVGTTQVSPIVLLPDLKPKSLL